MTTATLIPGPPLEQEEWFADEADVYIILVVRETLPNLEPGVAPYTINWGDGSTLVVFTERESAGEFLAAEIKEWGLERGVVHSAPVEAFVEALGICVEDGFVERVALNLRPLQGWGGVEFDGYVGDASEFHARLKERLYTPLDS